MKKKNEKDSGRSSRMNRANGPLNPRFQSEAKSKIFLARKKNCKKNIISKT